MKDFKKAKILLKLLKNSIRYNSFIVNTCIKYISAN